MQTACANFTVISAVAGKYPTIFYFFLNFFSVFNKVWHDFCGEGFERERERERESNGVQNDKNEGTGINEKNFMLFFYLNIFFIFAFLIECI